MDTSFSYDDRIDEQWGLYNSRYEGLDISISQAWNYTTGWGFFFVVLGDMALILKEMRWWRT